MRLIQDLGERPAAAFPSSHVGTAVVVLCYSFYNAKKLFWYFLPVLILIFLSTVYIRAHYLIDSIAGLLTGPVLYYSGNHIYTTIKKISVNKKRAQV